MSTNIQYRSSRRSPSEDGSIENLAIFRPGSEQGNTFLCPTSFHFLRNSCFDRLLWLFVVIAAAWKVLPLGIWNWTRPIFQSKTLTLKNKNLKSQNFLSLFLTKSYKSQVTKYNRIFDSKLHTRLIIEAHLFCPQLRNFEFESFRFRVYEHQLFNFSSL